MAHDFRNKVVVVRKEHKCWGCCRVIAKGEKAKNVKQVSHDGFFSGYYCNRCENYLKDNWREFQDDGIPEGMLPQDEAWHDEKYNAPLE